MPCVGLGLGRGQAGTLRYRGEPGAAHPMSPNWGQARPFAPPPPKDPRLHPLSMLSPAELLLPSLNLSGSDTRYFFS